MPDLFSLQAQSGKLPAVKQIGSYYYDDSEPRTHGEFDVVLSRADVYDIYEVKYHVSGLCQDEMEKEADKVRNIKGLRPGMIGFISASGFETTYSDYELIDGEMLYR